MLVRKFGVFFKFVIVHALFNISIKGYVLQRYRMHLHSWGRYYMVMLELHRLAVIFVWVYLLPCVFSVCLPCPHFIVQPSDRAVYCRMMPFHLCNKLVSLRIYLWPLDIDWESIWDLAFTVHSLCSLS